MLDVCAESVVLVFDNDDQTPMEFVVSVLQTVFGKSERDAVWFTTQIDKYGRCACGPYPTSVGKALLAEAEQRIREAGHPLRVTIDDAANAAEPEPAFAYAFEAIGWHFAGLPASRLVTTTRQFPLHMVADVQVAIDRLFASPIHFFGIHEEYRDELEFAQLLREGRRAPALAPPQYIEVDIGGDAPVKCLRNGLWLCQHDELRYVVVLSRFREYSRQPVLRNRRARRRRRRLFRRTLLCRTGRSHSRGALLSGQGPFVRCGLRLRRAVDGDHGA